EPTAHVPVEQVSFAFGSVQPTPQPPQLVTVLIARSQPSLAIPLQSAKCVAQVSTWQVPLAQVSDAFARLQPTPQPPQSVSVLIGPSQPSLGTPLQSAKSPVHEVISHIPLAHDSPALARLHGTPQPPQSVSVRMLRSHPLTGLPSQSAQPASHDAIA